MTISLVFATGNIVVLFLTFCMIEMSKLMPNSSSPTLDKLVFHILFLWQLKKLITAMKGFWQKDKAKNKLAEQGKKAIKWVVT